MRPLTSGHFRTPAKPSITADPALGKLGSDIAEAFTESLFGICSAPWRITAEAVTEGIGTTDGEGELLRLESERGSLTAHLMLDRGAVSALLEAAMGGTGGEPAFGMNERPLSRIESGLLKIAHAALANDLAGMLSRRLERTFSLFEGKAEPDLPGDPAELAQFRFVLNVFSCSGEIRLTLPRRELEHQIASGAADAAGEAAANQKQKMQQQVGRSELALTVTLANETLSVETIAGLRAGMLVGFTATASTPVIVWSGGIAAFTGTLARNGDKLAIELAAALA